jgi:hypothetical protein
MEAYTIVVLNDRETYSTINYCQILTITSEGMEALESGLKLRDLQLDPRNLVVSRIELFEGYAPKRR